MIYNFVNGRLLIAKMYDEFNIQSRDWESRAPEWILNGLKSLNVPMMWRKVTKDFPIVDYVIPMPCNVRVLEAVIYDNKSLERTDSISHKVTHTIIDQYTTDLKYYSINDSNIELEVKEGTVTLVYKDLPMDWDDKLGRWIPKVPDIIEVQDNIAWYLLTRILARGYSHPVYSLAVNNPHVNPSMKWKDSMKSAKNKANKMDLAGRAIMANVMTKFIANSTADIDELFNARR